MKERIFNTISIISIFVFVSFFSFKTYNAYKESTKTYENKYIFEKLKNSISKYNINNPLNKIEDEYIYTGKVNNNYLKYQGYLWRIIKINNKNEIVAITDETITYLPYNMSLYWLNDTEFEINKDYLSNTNICTNIIEDINNIECSTINNSYTIGTLSIGDYINAGGNKSYLNNNTNYWLSNTYDDNNSWYINKDGLISHSENTNKYGIRPVITIKDSTEYLTGNGTLDDPYVIEQRVIKTLNDTLQGEYISYNDEIWRIIYNKDNKIKIIKNDYIKYKNVNVEYYFDDKSNIVNTSKLFTFLNTNYLAILPNKEYLTKGDFYTGTYYKNYNNYTNSYKNKVTAYVGAPSINEPFIYELDNIFLSNPSNVDSLTTYSINNNTLYEDIVTSTRYIRPTLYLKGNINLIKGNGTIDNPYILGGINEA